jgi:hypothetical protein
MHRRLHLVPDAPVRRDSRGRRIGRNWWREQCMEMLYYATLEWLRRRDALCIGYETEERAYERDFPRPNLRDILISNARCNQDQTA